jgi:ABC-type lipoprotein export system ATPase subunit
MDSAQPITDERQPNVLAALAEAARADRRTAARFVEPRIGILQEAATRRHEFVLEPRGVGKSTLLREIECREQETDSAVVFVDIETLRDRPAERRARRAGMGGHLSTARRSARTG